MKRIFYIHYIFLYFCQVYKDSFLEVSIFYNFKHLRYSIIFDSIFSALDQ